MRLIALFQFTLDVLGTYTSRSLDPISLSSFLLDSVLCSSRDMVDGLAPLQWGTDTSRSPDNADLPSKGAPHKLARVNYHRADLLHSVHPQACYLTALLMVSLVSSMCVQLQIAQRESTSFETQFTPSILALEIS